MTDPSLGAQPPRRTFCGDRGLIWADSNYPRDRAAAFETQRPESQDVHFYHMLLWISLYWHRCHKKKKKILFLQYFSCPKNAFLSKGASTEPNSEQTICTLHPLFLCLTSSSRPLMNSDQIFPDISSSFILFFQFLTSFLNLITTRFLFDISLSTNHKIPFIHSAHVA